MKMQKTIKKAGFTICLGILGTLMAITMAQAGGLMFPMVDPGTCAENYLNRITDAVQMKGFQGFGSMPGLQSVEPQSFDFTSIEDTVRGVSTQIWGINNDGVMAGAEGDFNYVGTSLEGIIIENDVRTKFTVPDSEWTWALDINKDKDIVGYYALSTGAFRGFLRTADGTITTIHVPGSTSTMAEGINDAGQIVGGYSITEDYHDAHGFLYQNGNYSLLEDYPGAITSSPLAINNVGTMVGTVRLETRYSGLIIEGETMTIFDFPGSLFTQAFGINDSGQIVGSYMDAAGGLHSFTLKEGVYNTFDPPGSRKGTLLNTFSSACGINNSGLIVGSWNGENDIFYGYKAIAADTRAAPSATELSVSVTGNMVGLSWTSVAGASGYYALYFPANLSFVTQADFGDQVGYVCSLPSGAHYFVAVRAYNSSGVGGFSRLQEVVVP